MSGTRSPRPASNGMEYLILFYVFIFGTIIGSFLNVVIFRYNTGFSLGGRSVCLYCGKELKWYELIPLVSFLALSGRCRTCKSRLSIQYPAVEFVTGVLFVFSFIYARNFSSDIFLAYLFIIISLLTVITAYDLRHKIIPDGLVFTFIALAFIRPFAFPFPGESLSLALIAGPLFAAPFALTFFLSKGKWMGLGDAKLILGIGFFLGLARTGLSLLFSIWIGALISVILLFLRGKQFTMKSEIPFAPFLVIGALLCLFIPLEYWLTILGMNF